jgi:hypothetical protein
MDQGIDRVTERVYSQNYNEKLFGKRNFSLGTLGGDKLFPKLEND